jgi:Cof subfamily protein (haloacid dehalogenase superfamily)
MSIRLLVCDVDGTLVDQNKQLTPATIAAVARLHDAGMGFTIISARPCSGMLPLADALGIDAPMAAFNGGIVFRRDGSVDSHVTIDETVARGVFDLIGDAPVDRWVFADNKWHASTDQGVHVEHERVAANQAPIVTQDFAALLDRADKITLVSDDPSVLGVLADRAKAAFGDKATVAMSQTYYLDVTALAANKGHGITALAAAFDVPLELVAAIGDQANDLPMLARAGVSVAMGNGPEAVRHAAQHVTLGNDQDGVAHAIDTLIAPRF